MFFDRGTRRSKTDCAMCSKNLRRLFCYANGAPFTEFQFGVIVHSALDSEHDPSGNGIDSFYIGTATAAAPVGIDNVSLL